MLSPIYCHSALLCIWIRLGIYESWNGIFLNCIQWFLFFNENTDMHRSYYAFIECCGWHDIGFGTPLCKIILLCFCSFLFWKESRKYLNSSWKEKPPFFTIFIQPLSPGIQTCFHCLFYSKLSKSQAKSTKGRAFLPTTSELKCFTRRVQMWNLLCCCLFLI